MCKVIFIFLATILLPIYSYAEDCFIAKKDNKILIEEGDCKTRHAPCSTFKIAISIMGFNENILIDETHPVWFFQEGYSDYINIWKESHNPTYWMSNSCVWYSQKITQQLGVDKFRHYLSLFNYGNQDISGDKDKNNGLTHSWLSSSLEISPIEQVTFLSMLIDRKLPVSKRAQDLTRKILFIEDFNNGWKLYGKTGSGVLLSDDRSTKLENYKMGWFVGWLEKGQHKIIFTQYYELSEEEGKQYEYAKPLIRKIVREKLTKLLKKINY